MSNMLECWICGKEHEYCPTCGQTHGWKFVADTPEHYQIHMTIEDYRKKVLTREQATKILSEKCGVNANDDLSWMLPHVEKGVREIIGEKEKTFKPAKKSKLYKNE